MYFTSNDIDKFQLVNITDRFTTSVQPNADVNVGGTAGGNDG